MLSREFCDQRRSAVSPCVLTAEPAYTSSQPYYTLVNSKDTDSRSPKTYLCFRKSIYCNHLRCTVLTLGVCLLAVGFENPIFPLLSPCGTGKQITLTATWRSISASPQAPWPGTRILWDLMESTNQHIPTRTQTHKQASLIDWWSDIHDGNVIVTNLMHHSSLWHPLQKWTEPKVLYRVEGVRCSAHSKKDLVKEVCAKKDHYSRFRINQNDLFAVWRTVLISSWSFLSLRQLLHVKIMNNLTCAFLHFEVCDCTSPKKLIVYQSRLVRVSVTCSWAPARD